MTEDKFKRKLTTIFSADVAGYSRLMGEDEAATVKTLEQYKGIMSELIHQHRGRVVDSTGDNLLAEFTSVVDAVQCAVATQKELHARNAELPENRRMLFRIGINLGDVIEEGSQIYGDGVNIAARLESVAEPGGICISKTTFDQIESKLPLGYEYLGSQEVKNIAKPVDAYRVLLDPRVTVSNGKGKKPEARRTQTKKIALVGAAVLLVAIGAAVVWQLSIPKTPPPGGKVDMGMGVFPPKDKPSIAVLPFENMTGDSEQQYFCDGMADQIITALSRGPYLYVTSRTSSFAYRDKPMTAQQIAGELGVRYLIEGSVQRNDERLRVNVQLIEGRNGNHVWAEGFDRKSEDLFALQDEITMGVLSALNIEVTGFTSASLKNTRPNNLKAYEYYLKGLYYHLGRDTKDIAKAREATGEAVNLDPNFASAYRLLGFIYMDEVTRLRSKTPEEVFKRAEEAAQKAFELDPDYPPYTLWCHINTQKKDFDKAILYGQKGVNLDPNNPYRYFFLANALHLEERFEEANATFETAIRLTPFRPVNYVFYYAWSYVGMKQYDKAIPLFNEIIERSPKSFYAYLSYKGLAAAYELSGNHEKASWAAENFMRINPKYSLGADKKLSPVKKGVFKETMFDAYQRAGLK
jgi:adenylate cyclase